MDINLQNFFPQYFPVHDPVLIFSLVLFIILLAPVILNRIKIPSIIGLILAGVAVGPNGFNILLRDQGIILFGTVGLLYIMFLAGLEIDMNDFKKNRNKSMIFGALTFSIPMVLGTAVSYYLLEFGLMSSILLASMFASHTLLAYPIASRLGITKNKAVNITVGGTIITDTAALLVLAVITGASSGELNSQFWIRLGISLAIFSFIVLWVFPRITRWFFKNYETDGVAHYIFVLAMVFLSAFLAEIAGVEPIIGAFLAGLALNPLIPHTSPLMNRIEFVGNALFIPFFLIGVGMLVDLRVLFRGPEALIVAGAMIVVATSSKWMAAFISQKAFRFTKTEGQLMFGLSNAQAAATLAAVLIGYRIELLNENVLNGTILMILVTCIISSVVTEKAAVKQAIVDNEQAPDLSEIPERILVPIANADTLEQLIDLAVLLKNPKSVEPIYPLMVIKDDQQSKEKLIESNKLLEKAKHHAAATATDVAVLTRVDLSVTNGIIRAIKDRMITEVVIGWNAKITAKDKIFGGVLDNLLRRTGEMIFVAKLIQPVNTIKNMKVVVPPRAEFEMGFVHWVHSVKTIAKQTSAPITFYATDHTSKRIEQVFIEAKASVPVKFNLFEDWEDFLILGREIVVDDLLVIVSARQGSVSYDSYLPNVPKQLSKHFDRYNFVIIYPEQRGIDNSIDPRISAAPAY
ncbi:cation:proton antiporter [Pontibacter diazotrophicus]|uniref:Cation:proton antiporter n=1 Tax=Pontibacter diazotrophicus TaxID=1400979 RepID=A0A3D8LAF0_9BACT|nr:cation:proton antiporter [Pontibacter diazotrophicus]RDV14385.1 cation:proton antiporter [Pontibacter diazotrophicus]